MSPVNTRYRTNQLQSSSSNNASATYRPSSTAAAASGGKAATGPQGGSSATAARHRASSKSSSGSRGRKGGGLRRQGAIRRKSIPPAGRRVQNGRPKASPTDVLPEHGKHIYEQAFNHALDLYQDPKKRRGGSRVSAEEVAHKVAWSAVGHKYHRTGEGQWKEGVER